MFLGMGPARPTGLLRAVKGRSIAGSDGRIEREQESLSSGLGSSAAPGHQFLARAGHEIALWDERTEAIDEAPTFANKVCRSSTRTVCSTAKPRSRRAAGMRRAGSLEEALEGATTSRRAAREDVEVKRASSPGLTAPPTARRCSQARPPRSCRRCSPRRSGPSALPRRPSDQSALSRPGRRDRASPWTDRGVVERTTAFLRAAGHAPISMKREIDGFVVNRLQGALLEEAFRLVAEGFASDEDVDVALREGLALRWSFMGPFETIDLNAPAAYATTPSATSETYARIFSSTQWRADWSGPMMDRIEAERRARLPAEQLGERAAWRDRRLMALAAHKRRRRRRRSASRGRGSRVAWMVRQRTTTLLAGALLALALLGGARPGRLKTAKRRSSKATMRRQCGNGAPRRAG